ncbi:MAG: rhodanese-like domain-containing protein [Cyclobacteriaceae bacterium]
MNITKPTVSIEWLEANLDNPNLVILDVSLPRPMAKVEDNPFAKIQIPGARFFDIDNAFSDASLDLPHMMPSEEDFTQAARKLGLNADSKIIVYDNLGVYSSPRSWWMLRAMGHEEITVLDGGLPEWIKSGLPTVEKIEHILPEGNFVAKSQPEFFKNAEEVLKLTEDGETMILDARSKGRFDGIDPEPRAGLRGGHIPSSKCLPFPEVVRGNKMLASNELKTIFHRLGVTNQNLIFSCGSGLTACIITLAAHIAGFDKLSVYDGSWSEWGQPGDLPVSTGRASS